MAAEVSQRFQGTIQMNVLDAAIYSKLNTSGVTSLLANGSASIFALQASEQATLPYIVFSVTGGGDDNLDARRTKDMVYFIRAYSQVSKAQAGSIDSAIDTALHLQTLSPSGWANYWTAREEDLSAVENPPSNQTIFMVGGYYRVRIEKT
jgi:hypothetical protein